MDNKQRLYDIVKDMPKGEALDFIDKLKDYIKTKDKINRKEPQEIKDIVRQMANKNYRAEARNADLHLP